jgi:hypothetical protein
MGDVFTGYQNLLNGTLDVVVHEWALDLNIGLENLSFRIVGTSIMMHSRYLETSTYVLVMHVIFQQTINNVQSQCFEVQPRSVIN